MCVCVCLEKHSPDVKLERKQSGWGASAGAELTDRYLYLPVTGLTVHRFIWRCYHRATAPTDTTPTLGRRGPLSSDKLDPCMISIYHFLAMMVSHLSFTSSMLVFLFWLIFCLFLYEAQGRKRIPASSHWRHILTSIFLQPGQRHYCTLKCHSVTEIRRWKSCC